MSWRNKTNKQFLQGRGQKMFYLGGVPDQSVYWQSFYAFMSSIFSILLFFCYFQDMDSLDISSIRDTRTGKYAKVPKVIVMDFVCFCLVDSLLQIRGSSW